MGKVKADDPFFDQHFLQDVAGCLSRCANLRYLRFLSPLPLLSSPMTSRLSYVRTPSSDPSDPLPALADSPELAWRHAYPPPGADLFRREAYVVNLYGRTNPALRSVTMPAGTTWHWGLEDHDDHQQQQQQQRPPSVNFSPLPSSTIPSNFAPPLPLSIVTADLPSLFPAPIVPSSPTDTYRQASPALSTAWGWEPDPSCVEARAWWEQWGLKPFQSASPGISTTVGDDDDDDDDDGCDTDVDEDEDDEDEMLLQDVKMKEVEVLMTPRIVPSSVPSQAPERIVVKSQPFLPPLPVVGVKRKLESRSS